MNKKVRNIMVILLILIIAIVIFAILKYSKKEIQIDGNNELYSKVEQYLIDQEKPKYYLENKDSEPNYEISDFQVFADIARLGITKKGNETYVYVWALVESYYVQDNKLITNSGYSIPYKFIIENNEIKGYKVPGDGTEYTKTIKKIFPEYIRNKFNEKLVDNDKIREEKQQHYSYLY